MRAFKKCVTAFITVTMLSGSLADVMAYTPVAYGGEVSYMEPIYIEPGDNEPETEDDYQFDSKGVKYSSGSESDFSEYLAEQMQMTDTEPDGTYGVLKAEMDDDRENVIVDYYAKDDARLTVALYAESDGQLMTSATTDIASTNSENNAEITVEIENVPDYFVLKAFIYEKETYMPLGKVYESRKYIKEIQDFLQTDINDYDANHVVNLDDNEDRNFLVLGDSVKLMDNSEGYNQITETDDGYVVENFKMLDDYMPKYFDIVAYVNGKDVRLMKINTIKISGTTATIKTAEITDKEKSKVFENINIDVRPEDYVTDTVSPQSAEGTIKPMGSGKSIEDMDQNAICTLFEGKIDGIEGFFADIKITAGLGYEYVKVTDISTWSVMAEFKITGEISMGGDIDVDIFDKLPGFKVLSVLEIKPVVEIKVECSDLKFEVEIVGSIGVSEGKMAGGLTFGGEDLDSSDKDIGALTTKVEISLDLGLKIGVVVDWGLDEAELVNIKAFFETTLTLTVNWNHVPTTHHPCNSCYEGTLNLKFSLKGTYEIPVADIEGDFYKYEFFDKKIASFYYCSDDGSHGFEHEIDKPALKCAHRYYPIYIKAVDEKTGQVMKIDDITGYFLPGDVTKLQDKRVRVYTTLGKQMITIINKKYDTTSYSREIDVKEGCHDYIVYCTHKKNPKLNYPKFDDEFDKLDFNYSDEELAQINSQIYNGQDAIKDFHNYEKEATKNYHNYVQKPITDYYNMEQDGKYDDYSGYSNYLSYEESIDYSVETYGGYVLKKRNNSVTQLKYTIDDFAVNIYAPFSNDNYLPAGYKHNMLGRDVIVYLDRERTMFVMEKVPEDMGVSSNKRVMYKILGVKAGTISGSGEKIAYISTDGTLYCKGYEEKEAAKTVLTQNFSDACGLYFSDEDNIRVFTHSGASVYEYNVSISSNTTEYLGEWSGSHSAGNSGISYTSEDYGYELANGTIKLYPSMSNYYNMYTNENDIADTIILNGETVPAGYTVMTNVDNIRTRTFMYTVWDNIFGLSFGLPDDFMGVYVVLHIVHDGVIDVVDYVIESGGFYPTGGSVGEPLELTEPEENGGATEQDPDSELNIEPETNPVLEYSTQYYTIITGNKCKLIAEGAGEDSTYNIYILKNAEDGITDDNLLYVAQAQSDNSGHIIETYMMKEEYENPDVLIVGTDDCILKDSDVTCNSEVYTGETNADRGINLCVFKNGIELEFGKDYKIYGDFSTDKLGNHKFYVVGCGAYKGVAVAEYTVRGIQIEGYQINTSLQGDNEVGGLRTLYSEDFDRSKDFIVETGLIYGLDIKNTGEIEDEMVLYSDNDAVINCRSTLAGASSLNFSGIASAHSFVMTMKFGANNVPAYTSEYYVRGYAVLFNGETIYSDVKHYSVYSVADTVYKGKLSVNEQRHNQIYDMILKEVNPDYDRITYGADE